MKKVLSIILAFSIIFGGVIMASADDELTHGVFIYSLRSDGTIRIDGLIDGAGGDLVIPSVINGRDVKVISSGAFDSNADITSVVISGTVKIISDAAFGRCSNLTSVTIEEGVEHIGELAFFGCLNLENIVLPSGIEFIGRDAFLDCGYGRNHPEYWENGLLIVGTNLIDVDETYEESSVCIIPEHVECIADRAFHNSKFSVVQLGSFNDGEGMTSVHSLCFKEMKNLDSVILLQSVKEIQAGAFDDNIEYVGIYNKDAVIGIYYDEENGTTEILPELTIPETCTIVAFLFSAGYEFALEYNRPFEMLYCTEDMHVFTDWIVIKEPDCSEKGVEAIYCEICYGVADEREIGQTGHSFGEWETVTPATCSVTGTDKRKCVSCGETEEREIAVLEHGFGKWYVFLEPDCVNDGEMRRVCACGHYESEIIPADAKFHNDEIADGVCDNCGSVLSSDESNDSDEENSDSVKNCPHLCHKDNVFAKIVWMIISYVFCLLGVSSTCSCGIAHY